jgi:hypothetical protein
VTFLLSYLLDGAAVRFTDFADHNGLVDSYSTTEGEPSENVVHFGGPKPLLTAFLLQKQVTSLDMARRVRANGLGVSLPNLGSS